MVNCNGCATHLHKIMTRWKLVKARSSFGKVDVISINAENFISTERLFSKRFDTIIDIVPKEKPYTSFANIDRRSKRNQQTVLNIVTTYALQDLHT
jgi:hypothetical protein